MSEVFMVLGFVVAAYSIVANDSIQTLGTFISSNHRRPWWTLWLFASGILTAVLLYGWVKSGGGLGTGGDPAYGRLDKFPFTGDYTLLVVIPPLALLLLTRYGYPVSTTFLILTFFEPKNLQSMLTKSVIGYIVAFAAGFLVFLLITKLSKEKDLPPDDVAPGPEYWVVLQWLATGFLWSQWLIQDLANIFIYLPRPLELGWLIFSLVVMILMQGLIFRGRGGKIQKIVTSKAQTSNIKAATLIDFVYAIVILIFKEWSNMPMSTTWVFLGLLGGREFALALTLHTKKIKKVRKNVAKDLIKALVGLAVSVILAWALPTVYEAVVNWFVGA